MAVPGGARPGGPGRLMRLVMWSCAGIAGIDVIAVFAARGQARDFAAAAVAAGVGAVLAVALLRWLLRLPWGDIIGLAALASLWNDLTGRR